MSPGTWDATLDAHRTAGGYGLLVLDRVPVRRVGFANRLGDELLGPEISCVRRSRTARGRPCHRCDVAGAEQLRLALLDRRWSERLAPFPDVGIELAARALRRARSLANMFTVSLHPKPDQRLHLLLWELADSYGRVQADGIHIDLPLTHELISQLAGAQRPLCRRPGPASGSSIHQPPRHRLGP